jgi:hypothetical protein
MAAALDVLELHTRHKVTAINWVCRDVLRAYYARAESGLSAQPQGVALLGLLYDTSVHLGHAAEVLVALNCHEADDPILHAVGYLLRASRRLADEGVATGWP